MASGRNKEYICGESDITNDVRGVGLHVTITEIHSHGLGHDKASKALAQASVQNQSRGCKATPTGVTRRQDQASWNWTGIGVLWRLSRQRA